MKEDWGELSWMVLTDFQIEHARNPQRSTREIIAAIEARKLAAGDAEGLVPVEGAKPKELPAPQPLPYEIEERKAAVGGRR